MSTSANRQVNLGLHTEAMGDKLLQIKRLQLGVMNLKLGVVDGPLDGFRVAFRLLDLEGKRGGHHVTHGGEGKGQKSKILKL